MHPHLGQVQPGLSVQSVVIRTSNGGRVVGQHSLPKVESVDQGAVQGGAGEKFGYDWERV